jgi:hypothetical protein
MREIKFRAWGGETMLYSHNNTINQDYFQMSWFFNRLKDTASIMQDKNGVGIYEGDIVECTDLTMVVSISKHSKLSFNVIATNSPRVYKLGNIDLADFDYHKLKVIGNIYENKIKTKL